MSERGSAEQSPTMALVVLGSVLALLVAGGLARNALGIEWSTESIRAFVADFGFWGPAAFVALGAVRGFLFIPGPLYLTVGGVAFGLVLGSVWGGLGLLATALWQYGLVRWLGAEVMINQIPLRMRGLVPAVRSTAGVGLLAVISAYPIGPIPIAHIAAAIAGVRLAVYTLAVGVGSVVRAAIYAAFGDALLEGRGVFLAGAVLVATLALPWLTPSSRAWIRANLWTEPTEGDSEHGDL